MKTSWWSAHRSDVLLLAGLWILLTGVYWVLASGYSTPRRYRDEFFWWEIAQSFAAGDGMTWRGEGMDIRSPLYVLYISLAMLPGWSTGGTYTAVHFLNAAAMSVVVFPTFFIARRFVTRPWAFVAAAMAAAVAAMNFTGMIGTEALAYPIATFALGSVALAVARVERRYWIWATFAVAMAALTRTQFVALAAVLPLAIVIAGSLQAPGSRLSFFERRREPLIAYGSGLLIIVVMLAAAPNAIVGVYSSGLDYATPSIGDLFYWLSNFTADLFVMTGIAPVIAAIALMVDREIWRRREFAAVLAVTLAATIVLVGQTAWFAAAFPDDLPSEKRLFERYVFYLAPLFFVCFVAFFKYGNVIRLAIATAISAVAVISFDPDLVGIPASYDAWGTTLIAELFTASPSLESWIGVLLAIAVVGMAGLLYRSIGTGRLAGLSASFAVALAATIMIGSQATGWAHTYDAADIVRDRIPQPLDFIDRATDEDVGMIITRDDRVGAYYPIEFWNDRVTRMYVLPGTPAVYSPTCPFELGLAGEVRTPGCDRIPRAFYIRTKSVRLSFRDTEKIVDTAPDVRLVVAKGPPVLAGVVAGRDVATKVVDAAMTVQAFAAPGAKLEIVFAPSNGSRVRANDVNYDLRRGRQTIVSIPLTQQSSATTFEVTAPTGGRPDVKVERVLLHEPGKRPLELTR